ncbi:putative CorA-like Mg2+ transporter protein [Campylobacter iguaniorum]|uniref:Putative CorA-like Mg2+ transporter protein n=1 Tax=Campylobacter iguaniorum TaxID=1244531 RepID=A0A076FAM0_9BACT|nr:CorA family divalent cation transporter [Campylobacter iguaniorum]AII14733.1 putative CorA-like Mg2+ transporter protein [Campylobacter iguaniorum]ALV24467.1 putative CorA-like Mg2+ transporter protein [Campylobacter iguaniorum]
MISDEHRKKLEKISSRSGYFIGDGYKFLMLSTSFKSQNDGYIFQNDEIFYTCEGKFTKISFEELKLSLDTKLKYFKDSLDEYEEQILEIENLTYKSKFDKNFLEKYFKLKRAFTNFAALHQYFMVAVGDFASDFAVYKKELRSLNESLGRIDKIIDDTALKLSMVFSYYSSLNDKKHSKNLYILTIISAFFLPLNLITGFFGMNTGDMFLSSPNGTATVLAAIVCIAVLGVFWFVKNKDKV